MPKTGKFVKRNRTSISGKSEWEAAIDRAASHLRRNRQQALRLRAAIALFKDKLASGAPWPGESATRN